MLQVYNYKTRDVEFNDIIDEAINFAAAQIENKVLENRDERMKNLNYALAKYATKGTRAEAMFAAEGLVCFKNPTVSKNRDVQDNYSVVLAQVINAVLPMVASRDLSAYLAEIHQVGWGETADFHIKSNELYKVNEIAEGVNRGVLQPIYDNEITVNAKNTEVAASVDWYHVATGTFDLGDWGVRYAKSFEAYIFLKIIKAMTSATTELGGAYYVSGFDTKNWTTLVQRVSAANGGAAVYAIGTLAALNTIYPSAVGLQYGLGKELAENGHLNKYMGATLIPVDQVFLPDGAVNTTGAFAIPDDVIYFVAAEAYNPVKIVFEGDSSVIEIDYTHSTDKTMTVRIQQRVGVAAVTGSKFATMELA